MVPAPIVLFCYNRLDHLKRTLTALSQNTLAEASSLFVYSDGPKPGHEVAVQQVRDYLKTITGFAAVKIIHRPENMGLSRSIIAGVDEMISAFGKVIVLEDDLVTAPFFLQFMNDGIERYQQDDRVASIHGYSYPVKIAEPCYFLRNSDCWGWATWSNAWKIFEADGSKLLNGIQAIKGMHAFDFEGSYPYSQMLSNQIAGKNNSWAVRWYASTFLQDKLTLFPAQSLVQHIGNDGTGTHFTIKSTFLEVSLATNAIYIPHEFPVAESMQARAQIVRYFKRGRSLSGKIVHALKYFLKSK